MKGIGFGLERIAWLAFDRPRLGLAALAIVLALAGFGITHIRFDENLRDIFAGDSAAFQNYVAATEQFVDPENELLVLVEGDDLAKPEIFSKLQDLQFELQVIDGVDSVFSLFALRDPPDANGDAALLVNDPSTGLTPALAARIRDHPILGSKLLSADGKAMMFTVTPSEQKAPLSVARALTAEIQKTAADVLAGTDVKVTVTGFAVVRATISEIIRRDQIVLNSVGALIGTVMSLLVFRSIVASIMAAVPAIVAALTVVGAMGLFGAPVTVMSTVVPALVMIFGYADGMHLCFAWRHYREAGKSVVEAERLAQRELGGACSLSAITTAIAFLSLVISSVTIVRGFGLTGALGTVGGMIIVLVVHGFITRAIGRFWKIGAKPRRNFLGWLEGPCAVIGRFSVRFAKPISALSVILFVVLGAAHFSVPPEHSLREDLPRNNPANAALGRIDSDFGGIYPLEIVVPLHGAAPTSAEAIARIRAVHEAVAGVDGIGSQPLSLWSLAHWLGGSGDAATGDALTNVLDSLTPPTRSRFVGNADAAIVTATVPEMPSAETDALVSRVEQAVRKAGGPDVVVTGVTVVNAREGARTISNLNTSLLLSVVANLGVIALAFRSLPMGIVSFLPNILPILATGTLLFLTGRGMQFTTVIALTVAFGIAVNDAVHFLNRFLHVDGGGQSLDKRLIETSARIGPVLIGSTLIIIAGMSTTLTSGMPTIAQFGIIASLTLLVGIVSDIIILPALIAGPGKRWFERQTATEDQEATA